MSAIVKLTKRKVTTEEGEVLDVWVPEIPQAFTASEFAKLNRVDYRTGLIWIHQVAEKVGVRHQQRAGRPPYLFVAKEPT